MGPWPPLVWMTNNEQCLNKKPSKWRYQVKTMHAANRVSIDYAARLGVPLLDWTQLANHSSKGALNGSEVCRATMDGVHVHHWVDRLRASLLLGYLCDESGTFRPPCVRTPDKEWARRCRTRRTPEW